MIDDTKERQQRVEALGELARTTAHDFYHQLGLIKNFLNFALRGIPDEFTEAPQFKEDIGAVWGAIKQGENLTNALALFAGGGIPGTDSVNVNQAAINVSGFLTFPYCTLELKLDALESVVSAPPGQIEQVIVNLAINARDAMLPAGGRLTIQTFNQNGDVVLVVSDTGGGMSIEDQERAWQPFFSTKARGGSGLGLPTAKETVEGLGGSITIESQPDQGTKIVCSLPITPEPARLRAVESGDEAD